MATVNPDRRPAISAHRGAFVGPSPSPVIRAGHLTQASARSEFPVNIWKG